MSDTSDTTTTYTVSGMTCDHCVASVTEEIGEIEGVQAVTVDLSTGEVQVVSDRDLDPEQVRAAVDEAGYSIAS